MAVVALTSARGAPGVTTTALAMTLVWPRPVLLVEADVAGGSAVLAGYLRGAVAHDRSLLALAMAHRHGHLDEELRRQRVALDDAGDRHLVPAIADPVQAVSLAGVWAPLATAFSALERDGVDVIVDAGRLGAAGGPEPLLRHADAVLLLTRSQLPAVAATRARAACLGEDLAGTGLGGDGLELLLVGEGRPYTSREIAKAVGVPVLASMAWDPAAAEVLSVGAARPRQWEASAFVRSARAITDATRALVSNRRSRLGKGSPPQRGTRDTELLVRSVGNWDGVDG